MSRWWKGLDQLLLSRWHYSDNDDDDDDDDAALQVALARHSLGSSGPRLLSLPQPHLWSLETIPLEVMSEKLLR